jgi:hypothetical protein
MREFYTKIELSGFQADRTLLNFARLVRLKLFTVWVFFVGPALTLPLLAVAIAILKGRLSIRWPMAGLILLLTGLGIVVWPTNPHYYSPGVPCLYAVMIEGLRRLYVWRRNRPFSGKPIAAAVVLTCLVVVGVRASGRPLGIYEVDSVTPLPWYAAETFPLEPRAKIIQALKQRGGKHLVVVRYLPGHLPFQEYVYNDADIDGSDIVWARELENPLQNLPLVNYFKDRSIWIYRPDEFPWLEPYPLSNFNAPVQRNTSPFIDPR